MNKESISVDRWILLSPTKEWVISSSRVCQTRKEALVYWTSVFYVGEYVSWSNPIERGRLHGIITAEKRPGPLTGTLNLIKVIDLEIFYSNIKTNDALIATDILKI